MQILNETKKQQTLAELFESHLTFKNEEEQLSEMIKTNATALALLKLKIKEAPRVIGPELFDQLNVLAVKQDQLEENMEDLVEQDNETISAIEKRLRRFPGKLIRLSINKINYLVTQHDRGAGIRWCFDLGNPSDPHDIKSMNLSTASRRVPPNLSTRR